MMSQRDREILVVTRDALDEAITAMMHGEPSLQNGAYDREAWQELLEDLEKQSKRATTHLKKTAVNAFAAYSRGSQ